MKKIILIILTLLLTFFTYYLYKVNRMYAYSISQKNIIRLSDYLIEYYNNNEAIPADFIRKLNDSGCLRDIQGYPIYIKNSTDDSFIIEYSPDNKNKLIISWNKDLDKANIESSIKKP